MKPGGRAALARRGHGALEGWEREGGTRSRRDQPQPHAPTRALNTTSQRCASTPYCKIPKRVDTRWLAPRGEGLPGGTDAAASSSLGSASVLRGFTMGAFYLKIRVLLQSFSEGAIWVPCANPKAPRFTGQTSRARPELMTGLTCLSRAAPRRPEGGSSIGSWVPVGRPARARGGRDRPAQESTGPVTSIAMFLDPVLISPQL